MSESTQADPMAFLAEDPDLAPLVEAHGPIELEPAEDLFERTVVSILRQQISMDAAGAIRERLFEQVEVTPEGILAAEEELLRELGCSGAKVEYLRHAAEVFAERGYDHAYFEGLSDQEVIAELTEIRGFGPWTARMVLMFGLGREDVFPVGDLGVRQGMHEFVDPDLSRTEMAEYAERWAPYRSYVALLFWRALEG